uniref:Uncharacterized protein n=1 Tax=Panagrellus redivivus TaxID=6233 RepID=A0A7E4W910_PANRE
MGFGSPVAAEDARILCCWRGNVMVALVWGWCLRVLWNIAWLAFWFAIGLNWMVFVAVVPIVILILVLIGWKLKARRFYVGLLVAMFTLLILDSGYLIYLIVSASMSTGALRGYVADAVARQSWKHGTTTALLIIFAVAQIISILTDIYFIFLTRRILAYLRRIASAPTDEEHQLPSLALPPRPGNGALTPNTAAKFAKFSSALQDQRISGDEPYIMAHISPQIEFPAGPPSLDSTIPDADAPDDYYYDGDVDDHLPRRVRVLTNGLETSAILSKDRELSDNIGETPHSLAEIPFYKPSEPLPAKTPPRPPKNLDIPKWEQMQYISDSDEENTTRIPRRPQYLDISTPGSANYSHLYDEYKTFDSDVVREVIRKATDASGVASPLAQRKFEGDQNLGIDDYGNRDRATTFETRSFDLSPEALQEYGYSVDIDRPIEPVSDDEKPIPSPVSDDSPPGVVGFSRTPRQVRHDAGDSENQFNLTRESVHSRKSLNDTVSFWTQGRASMRNTRSGSNSAEDEEYSVEDEDEDGNGTDITTSGTPDDDVSLATAGETSEDDDQRSLATLQHSGEDEDSRSEVESNTTVVTSSSDFDEIDDDEIAKLRFDDHKFDEEMAQLKKDLTKVVTATALLPEARPSRNSQSDDAFSTAPTSPAVARVGGGNPLSPANFTHLENHDSTPLTAATNTDYSNYSDAHFDVEQSSTVFDNAEPIQSNTTVYHPKSPSIEAQPPSQVKLTRSPELVHRPYTVDDFDTTLEVNIPSVPPVSTWEWQSKTTENWDHLVQHDRADGLQHEGVLAETDVKLESLTHSPVSINKIDEDALDTTSKRVTFDFSNVEPPAPTRKSSVSTEEEWKVVEEAYVTDTSPALGSVFTKHETEDQMPSEPVIEKTKTGTFEVGEAPIRDSSFSFSSVDEGDPWSTKVHDTVAESSVTEAHIDEAVLQTKSSSEDEEEEWRIVEEGEEVRTTVVPILPTLATSERQFLENNGSTSHRNEAYILGTYTTARDEENVSHGGVSKHSFNYSHTLPPVTTYSNPFDLPATSPTEHPSSIFDDDTLNWKSSTIAEHHIHLTGSLETIAEESETGATVPATQPPPTRQPSTPLRPPPQILVSGTHDQYPSSDDDDDSDQKSLSTLDDAEDSARRRAIKLSRSDSECTERSLSSASGVSSIHGHTKGAVKKASAISDDDSDEVASLSTLETRSQVSVIDSDAGDDLSLESASGGSGRTTPTHASGHSQGW